MVERSLSMREVWGSIPHFSTKRLFDVFTDVFMNICSFQRGKNCFDVYGPLMSIFGLSCIYIKV